MVDNTFAEFDKKEKKREHIGKIIVLTISVSNFVAVALNFIVNYSMISTFVSVALTVLFLCGFDWVRVLFAASMAWNAIWLTFAFFVTLSELKWWLIIIYIILIVFTVTSSALLFASRSVKEYLYVRKNG